MPLRLNPVLRFLVLGGVVYFAWYSLYELYIRPKTSIDASLIEVIVANAESVLRFSGYTLQSFSETPRTQLAIEGSEGVFVGAPCDGMALFGLFAAFIIAYPGPLKHKLWYIPLGLLLVHAANVGRVAGLVMIMNVNPEWLAFNHDYTFTILVYSVVFALWYIWVERFGPKKRKTIA